MRHVELTSFTNRLTWSSSLSSVENVLFQCGALWSDQYSVCLWDRTGQELHGELQSTWQWLSVAYEFMADPPDTGVISVGKLQHPCALVTRPSPRVCLSAEEKEMEKKEGKKVCQMFPRVRSSTEVLKLQMFPICVPFLELPFFHHVRPT